MTEPDTSAPTTCYRHTDRETGRRCTRCGRPACWECLRDAPVGAHCAECVKAEQTPAGQQLTRSVRGFARDPLMITKTIIGLNVLVFVSQIFNGTNVGYIVGGSGSPTNYEAKLGLVHGALSAGQYYRLVTSGFIHFGVAHIALNMIVLFWVGRELEPGIGRARFATLYFVSLLAGSFGSVILMSPHTVDGGASGAVFGVAAAAAVALIQRGVSFWQTGWAPLLLVNLLFSFAVSGISIGGHIGGLIGGAIVGYVMLHPAWGRNAKLAGAAVALIVAISCVVGPHVYERAKLGRCVDVAQSRSVFVCQSDVRSATASAAPR